MGWSEVASLFIGVFGRNVNHLTFPLRAGAFVPWRIAIITADLPGAVHSRGDRRSRQGRKTQRVTLGMEKHTQISFG